MYSARVIWWGGVTPGITKGIIVNHNYNPGLKQPSVSCISVEIGMFSNLVNLEVTILGESWCRKMLVVVWAVVQSFQEIWFKKIKSLPQIQSFLNHSEAPNWIMCFWITLERLKGDLDSVDMLVLSVLQRLKLCWSCRSLYG